MAITGFLPGLVGGPGRGRALGVGEVKFTGQILPEHKKVSYYIDMTRVIGRKLFMGVGNGRVEVDGCLYLHSERFESRFVYGHHHVLIDALRENAEPC